VTEDPIRRPPSLPDDGGVKWLLSGLVLRKVVSIAKSLLANELDLRDWMSPNAPPSYRGDHGERTDVWFDFMADTGDDPHVMEKLATAVNKPYDANVLRGDGKAAITQDRLPRGEFLLLGGDTAYVTPDEPTLRYRFAEPFAAAQAACGDPKERPIYAIPGNHDYYDGLVGFNRMFRVPLATADSHCVLPIAGHKPAQEASYLKILLPGEWELWAVDVGHHGLDYRQLKYFRPGATTPAKLIICTHAPPISSDKYELSDLDLSAYGKLLGEEPVFIRPATEAKPPEVCRLFLAGHVHHYARYDGQRDGARAPTRTATVVAGAGGSFVHPTEHRRGKLEAAVKYPDPDRSRELTADSLTKPWKIIDGGYLWVVGAILATVFQLTWPAPGRKMVGPIWWAATVFASFGVIALGVAVMSFIVKRRVRAAKAARGEAAPLKQHPNGRRLSSAIIPVCIVVAMILPFISHKLSPHMNPLSPTSVWLTLGAALIVGMGAVGAVAGGAPHRIAFGLIGAIHGALQMTFAHLIAHRGWAAFGMTVAMWLAFGWIGSVLYVRRARVLAIAWWLLQGIGVACVLWFAPWPPERLPAWDLWLLAIVAGAIASPIQFGHYLLLVSAWGGHCNEAGITARSKNYKQWIRFHVTPDRLEGYVIGLDEPDAPPRLVDVFTIGSPQAGGG
jgi:hypothetical protein